MHMPQLDAYLFFDGTCAEAMRFYEKTLGGKLTLMTNAQSPVADKMPAGSGDRILHARLELGGPTLMASDWPADRPYESMKGFSLSVSYPTVPEAKRVFDSLASGGRVTMPFEKTFWAETFGMVVDRFGTSWMVNGGLAKN
jgi:PhnB protein